ncbi:MAG: DUF2130 domain-containing protein [FCB group bacterium]|nr:DUF2130 domain-containing protein [FCB group bacterium]
MNPEIIICPNCQFEIPLNEVLTHQIEDSLKKELQKDIRKQEELLAARKEELRSKEEALKKSETDLDDKLQLLLKQKEAEFIAQATKKAQSDSETTLKSLQQELEEKAKKLSESQATELELRKKSRDLEEREKTLALEVEKKLAAGIDEAQQKAIKSFQEAQQLKDAAYEKKIADMAKAVDEAKRKAGQGSMQTQGEVLELSLEDALKSAFRYDDIEPVGKGVRGADVIQTVKDKSLKACGKIIWESKNTKVWSQGWVQKLKDDQVAAGAEMAIIVTEAMPADLTDFGMVENVWVTTKTLAIPLAGALRDSLANLTYARNSAEGMSEKMKFLHQYIVGPEFRQKVEGIIETFSGMKAQLEKEKRAMTKLWKEREKQIDRVVENTSGMYGDFRGVIGADLKEISSLELGDGLEEDSE